MASAAEAGIEDEPFIAAVNRCANPRAKANPSFFANF
jgi:hypothetical protein